MTLSKILQEAITDSFSTPGKTDPGLTREASNEPPAEETHSDSTEEIVEPIPHESPVAPIPTPPVIKVEVDEEPITPVIMSEDTTLVDHLRIPVTGQVLTLKNQFVPTSVPEMTIHHQPASQPAIYTAEVCVPPVKSTQLSNCYPGPITEISNAYDMVNVSQDCGVRISKGLQQQLRQQLANPVSFGWQIVQRLFHPQELLGRNY